MKIDLAAVDVCLTNGIDTVAKLPYTPIENGYQTCKAKDSGKLLECALPTDGTVACTSSGYCKYSKCSNGEYCNNLKGAGPGCIGKIDGVKGGCTCTGGWGPFSGKIFTNNMDGGCCYKVCQSYC